MPTSQPAVDLAVEAAKQQITLATAILGGSLAFTDQLSSLAIWARLPWVYAPLAVSIVAGVLTIMALADSLRRGEEKPLSARSVRVGGAVQNASFMFSVVALAYLLAG